MNNDAIKRAMNMGARDGLADALGFAMRMPVGAFKDQSATYIDGFNAGRTFVADLIRDELEKRNKEDADGKD